MAPDNTPMDQADKMGQRRIGPFTVSAVGLGCMNLSHVYAPLPDRATAVRVLNEALDAGCTHLDTAALYGFGANEELIREAVGHRRREYMLATKCGLGKGPDGGRGLDGRPETLKFSCEQSLKRLGTDVIDLMYLHRLDRTVPIEDSVGALADMVRDGKVRTIGLSEMGAATLHRAHAVHPVAAMQTEYSLWTRNPEIAVLEACKALGAAFVAFSPLARKFLTGTLDNPQALPPEDLRHTMPRFSAENYPENQKLLPAFRAEAQALGCTMGQLALAWVLAQGDHVTPIPGTTSPDHARENMGAAQVRIPADVLARLDALINQSTVKGPRYSAKVQADVDTEEFTPDPTAATATANNP